MLTCFIRTDFIVLEDEITVALFLIIPFGIVFYSIYLSANLFCNKLVRNDSRLYNTYFKYIVYFLGYLILNIPMFILYIFTVSQKIQENTFLSWLSYFSSVFSVSSVLVCSFVRLAHGYITFDNLFGGKKKGEALLPASSDCEFDQLEQNLLEYVNYCFYLVFERFIYRNMSLYEY